LKEPKVQGRENMGRSSSSSSSSKNRKKSTNGKSSNSSPQSKPQQPRKLSVPELIDAAEHAVAMDDLQHAVTLYTVALHKCTSASSTSSSTTSTNGTASSATANDTSNDSGKAGRFDAASERQLQLCDLLERRAEVHVSMENADAALLDYQAALEALQQRPPDGSTSNAASATAATSPQYEILQRQAGLHMYIGQLSVADDALASYQRGCDCLLAARDNIASSHDSAQLQGLLQQLAHDYTRACCSIAELYLTDLCLVDNAEQQCELHIQKALDTPTSFLSTPQPAVATAGAGGGAAAGAATDMTMEAWQLMASLRLSQQRNGDATTILMAQVYDPFLAAPCRAVAHLVGLSPTTDSVPPTSAAAGTAATATELSETEMAQVQALPDFAFRCQTSKLLLECAHATVNTTSTSDLDDGTTPPPHTQNNSTNGTVAATVPPSTALSCAQAAVNVLASLVAENDDVIEVWTLLGDALYFVQQHDTDKLTLSPPRSMCRPYWERALEMLQVVQASLEEEIRDSGAVSHNGMRDGMDADDNDEVDEEDAMQHQLDDIQCRIEDLTAKLAETAEDDEEGDDMST
jgi:hypothetical protein